MTARLARFLPETPLARRLSLQSILYATGQGVFLTGSAVFFTQIVGLSAAQVGLGLTIAGVVTFAFAVPLGKLADRIGPKRIWAIGSFCQASLYFAWPWIEGLGAYIAMRSCSSWSGRRLAGRGAYTLDVFPHEERVRSQAFMRAALNIGFTVGALIGGLALAFNSDDIVPGGADADRRTAPAQRLLHHPTPDRRARQARTRCRRTTGPSAGRAAQPRVPPLDACDGVLGTNQVLLNIVIPLWLVEETDAPRVLLAWLFGTNTVMAVLLPGGGRPRRELGRPVAAGVRISAGFFVLSCVICWSPTTRSAG